MNDIVNFNKARKARVREADKAQAAANRVKFGRTRLEKAVTLAETDKIARRLDGAKREKD